MNAEALARRFHEAYERLAPEHGYSTNISTRVFDPHSTNGRLMIAVCAEIAEGVGPVEYKEVYFHEQTKYLARLNAEGADRWRLVETTELRGGWNLTFMREIIPPFVPRQRMPLNRGC